MKTNIISKFWFPIAALLFLLIASIVVISNFNKPQELRKRAATAKNLAEIRLTPNGGQFLAGETVTVNFSGLLQNQTVDGIQIFATIKGLPYDALTFIPSDIAGLRSMGNSIPIPSDTADNQSPDSSTQGLALKLAFMSENPSLPFRQATIVQLGTLSFVAPQSGQLSITFNQQLSKVMQNGTATDILEFPEDVIYSFIQPSPTPTPTPTPEPITCKRGTPLATMKPPVAESFPGDDTHYLVTLKNTDTAACPPTMFTFGPLLPDGWTMRNLNSLRVAPQNDTEFDIGITPASSARYGSYTVGLFVSGESADQHSSVQSTHIVAEPPPYHFEFHIKLTGVMNASASGFLAKVRFIKGDLDLLANPIAFQHVAGGVYSSGAVVIADRRLVPDTKYALIIKAEKHVAKKFCKITGQTEPCKSFESFVLPPQSDTPIVFDLTGISLDPGDLIPQDGKVDTKDIQALRSLFGKACAEYTDSDKLIGDLNYSGCIDTDDAILLRRTLQTRYDEN